MNRNGTGSGPQRRLACGRSRSVRAAAVLLLVMCCAAWPQPAASSANARGPLKRRPEPLNQVRELLEWFEGSQHRDGGWAAGPGSPTTVPDTAMVGLALLRAGNTTTSGHQRNHVRGAAEFLYRAVAGSHPHTLTVRPAPTALTARIGHYADTALALLFFAELRDAASPDLRYDGMMQKCIDKLQKTQNADGSWGAPDQGGASHAPLLGHALAVWALECAYRKGADEVDPAVLARAGRYALSQTAVDNERRANGKWKTDQRFARPDWLVRAGADDDEPVNHEVYMNAARLNVLYQADLSNRYTLDRELRAGEDAAALARVKRLSQASQRTRKALDDARAVVKEGWIKAHERDLHPSPGPLFFTGEDFLACLLTVDAMAERRDVEQWFPPVVRRVAYFHDATYGGLRTDQHVACIVNSKQVTCLCETTPDLVKHNESSDRRPGLELPGRGDEEKGVLRGGGKLGCPAQLSWCSKDRVFITAAGTMALLADTPYRAAFLRLDPKVVKRSDDATKRAAPNRNRAPDGSH